MQKDAVQSLPFLYHRPYAVLTVVGVWYNNMAAFAVKLSVTLFLLASSHWTSAREDPDEDGVYVTEEGGEEAPAYTFGGIASA